MASHNSHHEMKLPNAMSKTIIKLLYIIVSLCVFNGCKSLSMTNTDNIDVRNNSEMSLDILINHNYPDTAYQNARLNSYITSKETGSLVLVNEKWEKYLKENNKVTVFFAERKSDEFYKSSGQPGELGSQQVYGKLLLSQAKLDSLGGQIVFPDDIN